MSQPLEYLQIENDETFPEERADLEPNEMDNELGNWKKKLEGRSSPPPRPRAKVRPRLATVMGEGEEVKKQPAKKLEKKLESPASPPHVNPPRETSPRFGLDEVVPWPKPSPKLLPFVPVTLTSVIAKVPIPKEFERGKTKGQKRFFHKIPVDHYKEIEKFPRYKWKSFVREGKVSLNLTFGLVEEATLKEIPEWYPKEDPFDPRKHPEGCRCDLDPGYRPPPVLRAAAARVEAPRSVVVVPPKDEADRQKARDRHRRNERDHRHRDRSHHREEKTERRRDHRDSHHRHREETPPRNAQGAHRRRHH